MRVNFVYECANTLTLLYHTWLDVINDLHTFPWYGAQYPINSCVESLYLVNLAASAGAVKSSVCAAIATDVVDIVSSIMTPNVVK